MKTKKIEETWEKELRLGLDEIIEDMNIYDETKEIKSYQDEMFDRIYQWLKPFIHKELSFVRQQMIEEMEKQIKEMPALVNLKKLYQDDIIKSFFDWYKNVLLEGEKRE